MEDPDKKRKGRYRTGSEIELVLVVQQLDSRAAISLLQVASLGVAARLRGHACGTWDSRVIVKPHVCTGHYHHLVILILILHLDFCKIVKKSFVFS